MIEEQKREEEKEKKKEEEKKKAEKESKVIEMMKKRGIHLPAKILQAQQARERKAKEPSESFSMPNLDLNELIDELEE